MPFFRRRRVSPISERIFRVKRRGFLERNLVQGKKEYQLAGKEITAKKQLLERLLAERNSFLKNSRVDSHSREKLVHLDNTIAGLRDMIQLATRTQTRAKEMILHAQKELGIQTMRSAKKAA